MMNPLSFMSRPELERALTECRQELCGAMDKLATPIPMLMRCPECNERHIDKGEFATKHHHTHACQFCGHCWRPAIVNTIGVQFLPGFKDLTNAAD
jgi:predicted RNA-binding Zn-ribbon protein involved in translation (DUF1610 family)